jgi:hypothetical protein
MARYEQVSGVFFILLAIVQLSRFVLQWPVTVDGFSVPLWASAIAGVILISFAVWAFRTSSRATT